LTLKLQILPHFRCESGRHIVLFCSQRKVRDLSVDRLQEISEGREYVISSDSKKNKGGRIPGEISRLVDVAAVVGVVFDELREGHLPISSDIGIVSISVQHNDRKG
jgi:hypothetical protein